jgi:flavin-dependent dehydrogenase
MATGNISNSDFDVIVVGGGPAGAATGITCALGGLNTCIIERAPFPRDRPGEALHPGVEVLFRQLGVTDAIEAAGFLRYSGVTMKSGSSSSFRPFGSDACGPWKGFQAWRPRLDGILLERARSVGSEIRQPCTVRALTGGLGTPWTLQTANGPVTGLFLVDAGGGSHWLARRLRLPITRLTPNLIAHYAYCSDERDGDPDVAFQECGLGWSWVARVRPKLRNWTALSLDIGRPPIPPAEFSPEPLRHADVTWRFVPGCAGSRYFLVGDAAAVIDPAASHGVLKALMSGILAGRLIDRLVNGVMTADSAADCYRQWLLRWFLGDAVELASRYSRFENAPSWLDEVKRACEAHASGLRPANETSPSA